MSGRQKKATMVKVFGEIVQRINRQKWSSRNTSLQGRVNTLLDMATALMEERERKSDSVNGWKKFEAIQREQHRRYIKTVMDAQTWLDARAKKEREAEDG